MKKLVAAAAVMALFTSFANAAVPGGNAGVVKFEGEIVDSPCGIDPASLDQTVLLGQVPTGAFTAVGDRQTNPQNFDIVLTDCNLGTATKAAFTFTGASIAGSTLFGVTGGSTGVGIRLVASTSEVLENGKPQTAPFLLQNGDNTLTFSAMYESAAAVVTAGTADATVNFTIAYT